MALKDDLEIQVAKIFGERWERREGLVVPDDTTVGLGNKAVIIDATVLYADLSGSTKLVDSMNPSFAAEIYKSFLYCSAKIIRSLGGTITAYDGDRVMAVYVGTSKNTNAAKTGLHINWACKNLIQPLMRAQYSTDYILHHTVGIDSSQLMVAKTGIRGSNDLVWVGRAANWAAKLTTLSHDYPTRVTKAVYDMLASEAKIGADGRNMWEAKTWTEMSGASIYRSNWWWRV